MAQPDVYTPAHAFVADSANIPDFPGQNIDVELAAIAATFADYRTNLALIQQDDGALVNGSVSFDTLDAVLQAATGNVPALTTVQALATTATTAATAAAASAAATLANWRLFQGQYYGAAASDPLVDPLGAAPTDGDLYTKTGNGLRVYYSSAWHPNQIPVLTDGQLIVGQTSADPLAKTISGDLTLSAAGAATVAAIRGVTVSGVSGTGNVVFSTSPTITNATINAPAIVGGTATGLTALSILSTGAAWNMTFATAEVLTAGRTLSFVLGNVARTLTFSANATIGGTNTGDQTIALTGDVTGTGVGSFAATIAANVVSYAKFQQVAAVSLVGNATGSLANATGITLGAALAFSGSALQTVAHTGDITTPANSLVTTLATVNANVGAWGSATSVPTFTVNGKGLVTAASNTAISLSTNTVLHFSTSNVTSIAAASTWFLGLGTLASAEIVAQIPISQPATIKNLYISQSTAPGGVQTSIYTVRKNGVDTTLTATVTGAATIANDTTHTFTVVAGDLLSVKLVTSATAAAGGSANVAMTAVTTSP